MRTIESIVDSHRRATELRKAGKPIWTYHIDIRSIINESNDTSIERIADVSARIAAKLRAGLPGKFFDVTDDDYDMTLDEAVENLEANSVEGLRSLQEEEGLDVVAMFNSHLDDIYDWADRDRAWLG